MKQYKIEPNGYYPLTTQELIDLLETAITLEKRVQTLPARTVQVEQPIREINSILSRLVQAVPGYASPEPADGPVAQKIAIIQGVFTGWIENPRTLKGEPITVESDIVETLLMIMKQ